MINKHDLTFLQTSLTTEWNDYVHNHPAGWVCHTSQWEQLLYDSFKSIRPNHLIIRNKETNAIAGGLPLYAVSKALRPARMVHIPFATLADPLVDNEDMLAPMYLAVIDHTQEMHFAGTEIVTRTTAIPELTGSHYCHTKYVEHEIDLTKDDQTLFKSFHRTCIQQHIHKSEKIDLSFSIAVSPDDVGTFNTLYEQTRRRLGLPALPQVFFMNTWKHLTPKNYAGLFIVKHNSIPVAAMMALMYKNRFSAETIGWNESYKKLEPVVFLFWRTIQWARAQGFEIFDFGRTALYNTSLLQFKGRWGTTTRELRVFGCPCKNKGVAKSSPRLRMLMHRIPMPMYRIISGWYYSE